MGVLEHTSFCRHSLLSEDRQRRPLQPWFRTVTVLGKAIPVDQEAPRRSVFPTAGGFTECAIAELPVEVAEAGRQSCQCCGTTGSAAVADEEAAKGCCVPPTPVAVTTVSTALGAVKSITAGPLANIDGH
jgi:hypothetical protein